MMYPLFLTYLKIDEQPKYKSTKDQHDREYAFECVHILSGRYNEFAIQSRTVQIHSEKVYAGWKACYVNLRNRDFESPDDISGNGENGKTMNFQMR